MSTIPADTQQHTPGRHARTDSKSSSTSERINAMMVALATLIAGADGRHAR
jgi:hypothetical protein